MTAQHKNSSYEDDDLLALIQQIETLEDERASIMAEAKGRAGGVAKRIKAKKAEHKELGIPKPLLTALLKQRALERKLEAVANAVPEDVIEFYEDASGQLSIFAPDPDETPSKPVPAATKAARKAKSRAQAVQEQEQAEGAAVLDSLSSVTH